MKLSGIQKLTLLDFPGKTACTVFTPGCNFRCGYCHNSEFVLPEKLAKIAHSFIPEEVFFNFLETRRGLLDGVCITGGEPTIHKDLINFIKEIKRRSFKVKLDTNGTNPEMLELLLQNNLLDYVAMDIKASPDKYVDVIGVDIDVELINHSKDLLMNSDIDHEFRTTALPYIHTLDEFKEILEWIKGAKKYYIQNFRGSATCLDPAFEHYRSFTSDELEKIKDMAKDYVEFCDIRK